MEILNETLAEVEAKYVGSHVADLSLPIRHALGDNVSGDIVGNSLAIFSEQHVVGCKIQDITDLAFRDCAVKDSPRPRKKGRRDLIFLLRRFDLLSRTSQFSAPQVW